MLKLTVLTDNHTYVDRYYLGEPAACYYIEVGTSRLLLDTGYSDVYVRNAAALSIDLSKIDTLVVSHGHNDHTGGLKYFPACAKMPKLIGHPNIFEQKRFEEKSIGNPFARQDIEQKFSLALTKEPVEVADKLFFLGQIERINDFENKVPIGERFADGKWQPDFVLDDSALAYKAEDGLVIITGCSHAGICNICEYAKQVTGVNKLHAVIGGFHLMKNVQPEQLSGTVTYFKNQQGVELYPCHCTCFMARAEMYKELPIHEVGVSLALKW